MYAGTLSYFAQLQAQYELSALSSKAKTGLLAAKGIFGYEPKITYLFGLPRTISSGGIHLDIETTRVVRALDNDQQKTIDFAIQTGPIGSALEHQVPEQMFNTDQTNPTQGVSTVKALQLANAQGQQIYKIDQTNIDTVLPKLNLSDTIKQDIQSSVNAGKYVITHTDNVSVPGWSGAGYAIIDPLTGSDAYMISGGENGGNMPNNEDNAINALLHLTASLLGFLDGAKELDAFKWASGVAKYLGALGLVVSLLVSDGNVGSIASVVIAYVLTSVITSIVVGFLITHNVPGLIIAMAGMFIASAISAISILLNNTFALRLYKYRKIYV
jgi:hypothetical protein